MVGEFNFFRFCLRKNSFISKINYSIRGEKMNFFYNKKNQKIIAGAIALLLVVALVITTVASF